ncbi:MAG: SCO family protein [Rhodocyclaceae bacterium]
MSRRSILAAGVAVIALALAGCKDGAPQFNSTDITGAEYGKALRLTDQDGKVRTMDDFQGKVVAVFFGYTMCPDVCPTTLAMLVGVKKKLAGDADRVQVVFVTVDPERDTPEQMGNYARAFDASNVALRGTPEETAAVAKAFNVFYQKNGSGPNYTMDHTAGIYVFDPKGRARLFVRNGETPERLTHDIQLLLNGN